MSRYELTITADFSAAHRLRLLDGSIEPLHGHNWHVELSLEGERLDGMDVLADFTELQPRLVAVTAALHNSCLNDHPAFGARNPSTELVAKYIYEQFSPGLPAGVRVLRVRVWETATCAAAYIP